jgi:hypothetical protein
MKLYGEEEAQKWWREGGRTMRQYNLRSWLTEPGKPSDRRRRDSRERSGSTWTYDGVTGLFKVRFWNMVGLSKVGSKNF